MYPLGSKHSAQEQKHILPVGSGAVVPPWITSETRLNQTIFAGDDGDLQLGEPLSFAVNTTGAKSGLTAVVLNGKTDNHSNNTVTVLDSNGNEVYEFSRTVSASVGLGSDGKLLVGFEYTGPGAAVALTKRITVDSQLARFSEFLVLGHIVTSSGWDEAANNGDLTAAGQLTSQTIAVVTDAIADDAPAGDISLHLKESASEYANAANAASLSGYTDWRVPNGNELAIIFEPCAYNPAINTTNFPAFPSDFILSSEIQQGASNRFSRFLTVYSYFAGQNGQTRTRLGYCLLVRTPTP